MSDWAGIKKAINSNLSLPLNEKIDRDIEENRIGKGIVHSSSIPSSLELDKPQFDSLFQGGSTRATALVKLKDKYYLVGTRSSGHFELNTGPSPKLSMPTISTSYTGSMSSMFFATVFVYKNAIYYTGGNNSSYCRHLYKFTTESNAWTELSNVPFDIYANCGNYEFEGLAYIYLTESKEVATYNGSTWSKTSLNDSNLDKENKGRYGYFFEYRNNLYLCISDFTRAKVYFYVKSGKSFVPASDIPNISYADSSIYETACGAENKLGELYVWSGKRILKLMPNNTWKVANQKITMGYSQPILDNDILYGVEMADGYNVTRWVEVYSDYTVSGYLPKNSEIIFDNEELTSDQVLAIKNCEVVSEGRIKVLEDGSTSFRIVNDHWRKNTNLLIR